MAVFGGGRNWRDRGREERTDLNRTVRISVAFAGAWSSPVSHPRYREPSPRPGRMLSDPSLGNARSRPPTSSVWRLAYEGRPPSGQLTSGNMPSPYSAAHRRDGTAHGIWNWQR